MGGDPWYHPGVVALKTCRGPSLPGPWLRRARRAPCDQCALRPGHRSAVPHLRSRYGISRRLLSAAGIPNDRPAARPVLHRALRHGAHGSRDLGKRVSRRWHLVGRMRSVLMLHAVRRLLAWLSSRRRHPPPDSRRDPYAWKPAPVKPQPTGRGGAVAVAEPDDR